MGETEKSVALGGACRRVLLDDEELVLRPSTRVLGNDGFEAAQAEGGRAALGYLERGFCIGDTSRA
jgi:hypothetical protein